MKRLILIAFILTVVFHSQAQIKPHSVDSSLLSQFIDEEKRIPQSSSSAGQRVYQTDASEIFDVNFYRCEWRIDPVVRFISGKVTTYFTISQSTDNITFDLSDTLTVDSVRYKSMPIAFQRMPNDGLQLKFPAVLAAGQKDSVSIYYQGVPKQKIKFQSFNQKFHHSTIPVMSTLSEPYGAKEWWPCKNGLTDKADSIDIIITSPAAYKGVANGVQFSDTTIGNNRTLYYKHRYPIATYLVGVTVSNYVTEKDSIKIGNKMMPVIKNYYPESIYDMADASYYAKLCLPKFSQLFGDYPFINEQYSQTQWSTGGGMEHQSNSFIVGVDGQLIAHELGHQWFGDKVTCGSWQHIWLNEGFADYMEFMYVENFDSTIRQIHLQAHLNLGVTDSSGSVFVTDTTNPTRIFSTNLTYMKGGYVLHMLRGILGDSIFFKSLRTYLNDPVVKNKFAVTADLERNIEQVSGKDFQSFFKKWIYGEGYPNYSSTWYQNNNGWAKVQLNQTTTHPSVSFYEMPVQLRFKNSSRDTIITVNHQYSGQVFWVNPGFISDTMMIDPYLWILAKEKKVQKLTSPGTTADFVKIYPNPVAAELHVSIQNPAFQKITAILYDALGRMVWQSDYSTGGADVLITIPTSQLSHGIYIVKIADNKNILGVKKIVK